MLRPRGRQRQRSFSLFSVIPSSIYDSQGLKETLHLSVYSTRLDVHEKKTYNKSKNPNLTVEKNKDFVYYSYFDTHKLPKTLVFFLLALLDIFGRP